MTIETVIELFVVVKEAHDNFKDNEEASLSLGNRLNDLKALLLKLKSRELSIGVDALKTLEEVLKNVKQIPDEYD